MEQENGQGETIDTGAAEGGGEQYGPFYGGLSEELRSDPTLQNFKSADLDTVAKTLVNQQKMVGRDKVVRPNFSDSADVQRFYKDIGWPESPDKYEGLGGDDWAKEVGYNPDAYREIAHKAMLTPDQARVLEQAFLSDLKATAERKAAEDKELFGQKEQELRQQWGPKYDEKMQIKDAVIDRYARTPEAAEAIKQLARTNPEVAATLSDIATQFAENKIGDFTSKTFTLSASEAQDKLNDIRSDMSHPYWRDDNMIAHQAAVDEVLMLEGIVAKGRQR